MEFFTGSTVMFFKRHIPALIFLAVFLNLPIASATDEINVLDKGNKLPQFTVTEGKKTVVFPDDFNGKVFAVYFGDVLNNNDGFQFLSWGGAFTVSLRQGDESLHDVYFAGIASLKNRPLYWVPFLVRKTFQDEVKKNTIKGEIFYDWENEIADKFNLKPGEVKAVIVDKKGIIRRSFDCRVYNLSKAERKKTARLFLELINEKADTEG